jgi:hypothetical protein
MPPKPNFILASFDKRAPGKIGNFINVLNQNSLLQTDNSDRVAIAEQAIDITDDGQHIFAVQIVTGSNSYLMFGFTSLKSFDCNKEAHFGFGGLEGTGLSLADGNLWFLGSYDQNVIDPAICKRAKEVICILTVVNGGKRKEIRFVVDGKLSRTTDVTTQLIGDRVFPAVCLRATSQHVVAISIDETKNRNPEIEMLVKLYQSQQQQQHQQILQTNNNNDQSGGAVASSSKELDEALQKISLLAAQLKEKDDRVSSLEKEVQQLKQQLSSLSSSNQNQNQGSVSPFVADKLYQIDLAKNGVKAPSDPNAFGTVLPVLQTSPLFLEATRLFRVGGSNLPSISPVAGFSLEKVDVIFTNVASLEIRMNRLKQLRTQAGSLFNPASGAFTAEQLQSLIALRDNFLPRSSSADPKTPNLVNVFHGTKVDRLKSVVNGLVAVRSTDAGFFGSGCYTTTSIEYAARYAVGEFNPNANDFTPRADGCYPVVWCVAAVGVCYPLTREVDYSKKRVHDGMQVSDYFGSPLHPGYDCHCVAVNESSGFQAVPRKEMQYMEIVFDQEVQVLPIAVLWVKTM